MESKAIEAMAAKNPAAIIAGKRCPTCKCRDLALSLHGPPVKVNCLCCGGSHKAEDLEDVPAK